ncbi:helix-turn-helix transcriptional regulator [Streptomyces sp. NPDC093085]|uniref:helix-turn-helix transcriptional regulator n=1 Tax=Streptomyces sp. NPDC093085 TaxID=3155068 RepID=UPI003417FF6C
MIYQPPTALPPDLLADEGVLRALRAHDFGQVFRIVREKAGISYSKIAAECGIKPERVGQLARGTGRVTTFEKIVQIADALRVPGHVIGLAPRPWEADVAPAPSMTGPSMHRRAVLQVAGGLAATLPTLHQSEPPPVRVTDSYVDRLHERTARLRRLDDTLGGGDTFRVYLGEMQRTKALLRTGSFSDGSRLRLTSLLAEQAQQAGWAAFDSGRGRDAASLYQESRAYAREAQASDLHSNSLAFLAYGMLTKDRRAAVAFAQESCATATERTPSSVRALLYERLAWACAVDQQPIGTDQALHAARKALDEAPDGELQPHWSAWADHQELDIMTGRCWTELQRPLRSVPVLSAALAAFPDEHARDKALYLSWLAEAYLTAGEVEEAAVTTGRALELVTGVASIRPRQRIDVVLARLRPYGEVAEVREVLELADP